MSRFTILVVFASLVPTAQPAEPPGSLRVVDVKVEKDALQWTESRTVPVAKKVVVTVNKNGVPVQEVRDVTVYENVAYTVAVELKRVKATDGAGKAVDPERLAKLLKEKTPVVLVTGPVFAAHRALFKESTIFLELPKPDAPKGGPTRG